MKFVAKAALALISGAVILTQAAASEQTAICGDYWRNDQAYTSGQLVSYQRQNYRANWWTQAMRPDRPASSSEWAKLGACEYPAHSVLNLSAQHIVTLSSPSTTIGNQYRIHIQLPDHYQPQQAYPILYVADWGLLSQRETMQTLLAEFEGRQVPLDDIRTVSEQYQAARAAGEAAQLIIVGIECPDELLACMVRRERDFTPRYLAEEDAYVRSSLLPDLPDNQQISGGAPAFTQFLQEQLIPTVERRFRVDTSQRGFHGTSLSGLYGADLMLTQPKLFSRYLLNSPALWYDNLAIIDQLANSSEAALRPVHHSYISIGELESDERPLAQAYVAGLQAKKLMTDYQVLDHASHLLAPIQATRQGLPLIYPANP